MTSRSLLLFVLLGLLHPLAKANTYSEIEDMKFYLEHGTTILVVECLSSDDEPVYHSLLSRKVRVIQTLHGEVQKGQIIHVIVHDSLEPSHIYMIYSGENVTGSVLNANSYRPPVVEITLWGEVNKAEKEKRVADFLGELEPMSLNEKLRYIIIRRLSEVKGMQQQLETEVCTWRTHLFAIQLIR